MVGFPCMHMTVPPVIEMFGEKSQHKLVSLYLLNVALGTGEA